MDVSQNELGYALKGLEGELQHYTLIVEHARTVLQAVAERDRIVKGAEEAEGRAAQAQKDVATAAGKLGEIRAETTTETQKRDAAREQRVAEERRLKAITDEIASIKQRVGVGA